MPRFEEARKLRTLRRRPADAPDPAKLVILARRFGDPAAVDELLGAWTGLNDERLHRCVDAQEVLLVAWLARMAARGTSAASGEARHRTGSLDTPDVRWRHLA